MKTRLILIALVIILAMAVGIVGWYLYSDLNVDYQQNYGNEENQENTADDSTAEISSELNSVPSDASLEGDMQGLDAEIQGF